jgi:uridine kinase
VFSKQLLTVTASPLSVRTKRSNWLKEQIEGCSIGRLVSQDDYYKENYQKYKEQNGKGYANLVPLPV